MTKAFYITAAELAQKGKDNIPDELLSAKFFTALFILFAAYNAIFSPEVTISTFEA